MAAGVGNYSLVVGYPLLAGQNPVDYNSAARILATAILQHTRINIADHNFTGNLASVVSHVLTAVASTNTRVSNSQIEIDRLVGSNPVQVVLSLSDALFNAFWRGVSGQQGLPDGATKNEDNQSVTYKTAYRIAVPVLGQGAELHNQQRYFRVDYVVQKKQPEVGRGLNLPAGIPRPLFT